MSWHANVPWREMRLALRMLRASQFQINRQKGRYYRVEADDTLEAVREGLGALSYAPNWEFSYFKGEDINLARVVYHEGDWWQVHARGWLEDDGSVWLRAHWELEPTEAPERHLGSEGYDVERGMRKLANDLEAAGTEFQVRRFEG